MSDDVPIRLAKGDQVAEDWRLLPLGRALARVNRERLEGIAAFYGLPPEAALAIVITDVWTDLQGQFDTDRG